MFILALLVYGSACGILSKTTVVLECILDLKRKYKNISEKKRKEIWKDAVNKTNEDFDDKMKTQCGYRLKGSWETR